MSQSVLHTVKVVEIIQETALAKTFVLQPLDGWQPAYQPGQFITLLFNNTGTEKRRSYSLISHPAKDALLRITVKRVENGEYSRYLLDHVLPGHVFTTSGIAGFFTLPQAKDINPKQVVFLAAGSGITPVFALLKAALDRWTNIPFVLIYSNRHKNDVMFYAALQALETQHKNKLHIVWLFSSSRHILHARLSNYLLNILLDSHLQYPKQTFFYMCGPFDYMLMIRITLLARGVPAQHIYKEQFSMLPRFVKPVPPDTAMHHAIIHISGQVHHLQVQYPHTILAEAKARHIELPYSCEAGRCGSCTATCSSGKIWMAYNEVLTDDEINKGRVLVCQAYPVGGDVTITYD